MVEDLPPDTLERVTLSYRLTFWSDVVSIIVVGTTVFALFQQRRAIRANNREPKCFGLILPIYLPVLWALICVFLLQALILGVPGPYPAIPAWFLGAAYASPQGSLWVSSLLYYFYWFAFELMSEGFAFLLLQPLPSPEAFAASLRWGLAYASLAAGLTTSGFVFAGSKLSAGGQLAIDGVFVSAPCLLYGTLLITMLWPGLALFFGCGNRKGGQLGGESMASAFCGPFKRLFSSISSRRSFFPYILFSLAWRSVSLILILSGRYSTPAGTSMTIVRTLVTPLIIYLTLVLDSRYWRNLATMALEGDEAIIVLSGASPNPQHHSEAPPNFLSPRSMLSPGKDSVMSGGSPPSSAGKRAFGFFPSFSSPTAASSASAAGASKNGGGKTHSSLDEDADADADADLEDEGDETEDGSQRRRSSATSGGRSRGRSATRRQRRQQGGGGKRGSSLDSISSADTATSSVASSVHSSDAGGRSGSGSNRASMNANAGEDAMARMRERLRLAHEAAGLSAFGGGSSGSNNNSGERTGSSKGLVKLISPANAANASSSSSSATGDAKDGATAVLGTTTATAASGSSTAAAAAAGPKQSLMIVSRSGQVRPVTRGRLAAVFLHQHQQHQQAAAAAAAAASAAEENEQQALVVADETTSLKSALLASTGSSRSKLQHQGTTGTFAAPSSHSRLGKGGSAAPISISAIATGAATVSSSSAAFYQSSGNGEGMAPSLSKMRGLSAAANSTKVGPAAIAAMMLSGNADGHGGTFGRSAGGRTTTATGTTGSGDDEEPLFLPPTPASSGSLWWSFLAGLGIRRWCCKGKGAESLAPPNIIVGGGGGATTPAGNGGGGGVISSPASFSAALALGPPGIIRQGSSTSSSSASAAVAALGIGIGGGGSAGGSTDGLVNVNVAGLLRGRAASAVILAELQAEELEQHQLLSPSNALTLSSSDGSAGGNSSGLISVPVAAGGAIDHHFSPQSNPRTQSLVLDTLSKTKLLTGGPSVTSAIGGGGIVGSSSANQLGGDHAFYGSASTSAVGLTDSKTKLELAATAASAAAVVPASLSGLNRPKSSRLLVAASTASVPSNSVLLIKAPSPAGANPVSSTGLLNTGASSSAAAAAGATVTTTMTSSGAVIRTNYRPELALTHSKHRGGAGSGAVGEDVDSDDDAAVDAAADEEGDGDADTETVVSAAEAGSSYRLGGGRGGSGRSSPLSLSSCAYWVRDVFCCYSTSNSSRRGGGAKTGGASGSSTASTFGSPVSRVGRSRPATSTGGGGGRRSRSSSRGRSSVGGISLQTNDDDGGDDDEEEEEDGEEEEAEASDSSLDRLLLVDVGVSMSPKIGKKDQRSRSKSRSKSKVVAAAAAASAATADGPAGGKRPDHVPPSTGFTPASSFYQASSSSSSSSAAAPNAAMAARNQLLLQQQQQQQKEVARAERLRSQVHSSLLVDAYLLEVGPFLDRGATSAVHAGKYRGKPVAIKMFRPEKLTQHAISFLHSEHKLSAALRHPNVVRYHGLCVIPPHISLIFDYCARGSLYNLIEKLLLEREMYASYYGIAALEAYGVTGQLLPPYCDCHQLHPAQTKGEARHPGFSCRRLLVRLSNGTLVEPPPPPSLSWRRRLRMARDGAAALAYLHNLSPPICSRDVKSQNLLVTLGYRLKLSDFGESRAVQPYPPWAPPPPSTPSASTATATATASSGSSSSSSGGAAGAGLFSSGKPAAAAASGASPPPLEPMTGEIGTIQWMAPEMMRADPFYYGPAIDVYSYGVVLWELATMQHPWEGVPQDTVIVATMKGRRLAIPEDCPSSYARLVQACWDADPKKRPSSQQVLEKLQRLLESWERKLGRRKEREKKARGESSASAIVVGGVEASRRE